MSQPCPDKNPLQRDGLSQPQRQLPALQPENTLIDERKPAELLRFLAAYAKEARIRFFDASNTPDNGEVWTDLMNYERYFNLDDLGSRSDIEPHFALMLSFLHLFEKLQQHQNTLTKRHLDFYYREVLQLNHRAPVPDRVHVLFELAKNTAEQIVPAKTELDAGKDKEVPKQPLIYQTANNLTVNRAKISHLRTVYIHSDQKVYVAPVTNTSDGVEKPLPADNPTWNGFGPKADSAQTILLPEAQLGFALAAPILLLAEGERTLTVQLTTLSGLASTINGILLRVELSGSKAWIDAGEVIAEGTGDIVSLKVVLQSSVKEAVVAYDAAKLDGGYATHFPVMRCWLTKSEDYEFWKELPIQSIRIDADVTGLKKTLELENDFGPVSSEKSFMPFGSSPAIGSTLYVGSEEALAKAVRSIKVHFTEWIGLPTGWATYYGAYDPSNTNDYKDQTTYKASLQVLNGSLNGHRLDPISILPNKENEPSATFYVDLSSDSIDSSDEEKATEKARKKFLGKDRAPNPIRKETIFKSVSDSLLSISLEKDFGHTVYPTKLTQAIVAETEIPNPPYTPVLKGLTLDYSATTGNVPLTDRGIDAFASRRLQLFHLTAFGQAEEHGFLKQNLPGKRPYLLPRYSPKGTFFMGLQDVGPQEAVAILVQVEEGSANPERTPPTVEWSVLIRNQWRLLTREEILSDTTSNLLTSGIVKFLLPLETDTDHTAFEAGHVWLRAELKNGSATAPIDSVCNFIGLHAQAVLANFTDQKNNPVHYDQPLAAETIKKSRQSLAAVKAIKQPYASFGGQPKESDDAFYTRVSERLRHKQRGVSIWDYEHLVLQAFPTIYKVKCLNHTRLNTTNNTLTELAPGHVTVVVVPDLRNLKAVNQEEPRVDLNTLQKITDFLKYRVGKQVTVQVTNPRYERIKLSFQVGFQPNFEPAVYKKVLRQDLKAFLTPWAFDSKAEIAFGGTVYKSTIIHFIERRPYVDFVTELKMQHIINGLATGDDNESITASDARAVLASAPDHDIQDLVPCNANAGR